MNPGPIAHWSRARFGCLMSTSWLVDSWVPLLAIHLVRACRKWKYSLLYLRQKCCRICSTRCYLFSLTSLKSTQRRPFKVVPTKKYSRLRYARSLGSALNDKGTRIEDRLNSSFLQRSNKPCLRSESCILQILWPPINQPRKWDALGEMKFQEISNSRKKILISDWTCGSLYMLYNSWICLCAPTKMIPLSEYMCADLSLREMNHLKGNKGFGHKVTY